jgi:hypothetical protein
MVIESANPPHRSLYQNITSSGDTPNEVERVKISKFRRADGRGGLFDRTPLQALLESIDYQRMNVVNVLAIVQSMSASFTDSTDNPAPEISAAFDLLEQELQRIVGGLERAAICWTFSPRLLSTGARRDIPCVAEHIIHWRSK